MFGAVRRKIAKAELLNEDEIFAEIISDPLLQAEIIDLNQSQLYDKGLQADGSETGQYSPITISYYKPLAATMGRDGRTDHITGKDTGYTYSTMMVNVLPKGFVINADNVTGFFYREPKALGLTKDSIKQLLPEIRERIIEKIRQKLK